MRLGQFVRSGVAHPLRDEARTDVTTASTGVTSEPVGAVAGGADDVGTDEADADAAAVVRHDLLDGHAG